MVNSAIGELVTRLAGEETWLDLCKQLGCPPRFSSHKQYDDSITFSLVKRRIECIMAIPSNV